MSSRHTTYDPWDPRAPHWRNMQQEDGRPWVGRQQSLLMRPDGLDADADDKEEEDDGFYSRCVQLEKRPATPPTYFLGQNAAWFKNLSSYKPNSTGAAATTPAVQIVPRVMTPETVSISAGTDTLHVDTQLYRLRQPGDGSCFFHSLCEGLGLDWEDGVELRRQLAQDFTLAVFRHHVTNWEAELSIELATLFERNHPSLNDEKRSRALRLTIEHWRNKDRYRRWVHNGTLVVSPAEQREVFERVYHRVLQRLHSSTTFVGLEFVPWLCDVFECNIYVFYDRTHRLYSAGYASDVFDPRRASLCLYYVNENHFDLLSPMPRARDAYHRLASDEALCRAIHTQLVHASAS